MRGAKEEEVRAWTHSTGWEKKRTKKDHRGTISPLFCQDSTQKLLLVGVAVLDKSIIQRTPD